MSLSVSSGFFSNLVDDTRHLLRNKELLGTTTVIVILLLLFIVLPVGSVLLRSFTVTYPTVTVFAKNKISDHADSENLVNQAILKSIKGVKGIEKIRTAREDETSLIIIRFQKIWDDLKGLHDIEDEIAKIKDDINPYVEKIEFKLGTETIKSLATYKKFFSTPYYHSALKNSLILATSTTLIIILLAFIFAYLTVNGPKPIQIPLRILVLVPFVAPRIVFALSLILLGGRMGLVTQFFDLPFNIYGWPGVIIAQVITFLPVGYLLIENVLKSMESNIEDAAIDMGASDIDILFRITIPLAAPGILKGALLVFILSLADFANPMLIGGEVPFLVKDAYLIYIGENDLELTAVFCVMLVIPSLIVYIFHEYVLKGKKYTTIVGNPQQSGKRKISTKILILMMAVAIPVSILIVASLSMIFIGAFTKIIMINNSFTLEHFMTTNGLRSLITSIKFALSSALIAPILGVTIAYILIRKRIPLKGVLEFTTLLGFAVPGTVIGVGYILFFNTPHLYGIIPILTGTFTIIVINEIFRNLSVSLEAGVSKLHQIDVSIEEAAIDMRASSFRVYVNIVLPLISSALVAGFIYTFMVAMIAISSVIFLISPGNMLASIFILSVGKQGFMGMACAISVMLILAVGACLGALWLLSKYMRTTLL